MSYLTPEAAHSALICAIDYELDRHGPASLADMIANIISARHDEDEPKPTDAEWQEVERAFEQLGEQLIRLSVSRRNGTEALTRGVCGNCGQRVVFSEHDRDACKGGQ